MSFGNGADSPFIYRVIAIFPYYPVKDPDLNPILDYHFMQLVGNPNLVHIVIATVAALL